MQPGSAEAGAFLVDAGGTPRLDEVGGDAVVVRPVRRCAELLDCGFALVLRQGLDPRRPATGTGPGDGAAVALEGAAEGAAARGRQASGDAALVDLGGGVVPAAAGGEHDLGVVEVLSAQGRHVAGHEEA